MLNPNTRWCPTAITSGAQEVEYSPGSIRCGPEADVAPNPARRIHRRLRGVHGRGRKLANLHVNYGQVEPYPLHEPTVAGIDEWELHRVQKMR